MQVRNWIGTLNGIDASFDAEGYLRTMVERGLAKYAVGQLERGSESGRLHLQYFVQMERSRRLAHMRSVICDRSHWEPMYGSVAQARAYATKDDTRVEGPWEFGLMSSVGKRRGLEEAVDCVKAGMSLSKVAEEFSLAWVAHGRGLTSLRQQLKLDADRRSFGPEGPEVWVLWGPSGTGKSRFVAARWPDAFWKAPESKWWDGYSGQETVVLDDFKDYAMPLVELQRLLDWYPLWVEVKGGSVPMMAKRYVLTSNTSPDDWYLRADPHRTVRRRISDFAERFGRLIECQAGWEASLPPGPGAGVGVILEPNPATPPGQDV